MSSYSLSSLQSTTKYGIAGFVLGAAGAYSLCSIWSSDSGSSSRSSSSGSGYDSDYTSNTSSNNSSMFGGSAKHRKKRHKGTRRSK